MRTITVITSAGLVKDRDAPQVFNFSRVLEVRDFLASAPRTGWVIDEQTLDLVTAGVRFTVIEDGKDITDQVVAQGWLQDCEVH